MLAELLCLESELSVPVLPLRLRVSALSSGDAGEEEAGLVVEELPKRRCVETCSVCSPASHQGQCSLRVSQPSSRSLSGQLLRWLAGWQGVRSSYQRWLQDLMETFRPATHIVAAGSASGRASWAVRSCCLACCLVGADQTRV